MLRRAFGRAWQALRRERERWRLLLAALLLLACLFNPQWPGRRDLFNHIVVLDVTQSMNVEDQQWQGRQVSRLTLARQVLRAALLELPCGSKVGWGLFTEYRSFLLFAPVEVCANLGELRSTLARIDASMAWTGNSEIAKGIHSGIKIAATLPDAPSLIFVTDGHEAPPVNPRHRPAFDGKPGEVRGLLVGVGELTPSPIPKVDPLGRPLGFWAADEVLQTDPRSQGRGGSVSGEMMVDDAGDARSAGLPGAVVGTEHLSALREAYLRLLAGETGLGYLHLSDVAGFEKAWSAPALARSLAAPLDLRKPLAALALLLLLLPVLGQVWRRLAAQRRHPPLASPPTRARQTPR